MQVHGYGTEGSGQEDEIHLPVPDWSSAGADSTTSWPEAINASLKDRIYDSAQPSSLDWTIRAHWAASTGRMAARQAEALMMGIAINGALSRRI